MPIKFRNIEAERIRLGLGREEFSKLLKTTRQTYSKQIRGSSAFSSQQLITLRNLTGKTIDYLLEEPTEAKV